MIQFEDEQLRELSLPQQNYIEVIGELTEEHGHAHTSAIAGRLSVSQPSVTEAMSRMIDLGLVQKAGHEIS